MWNGTCVVFFFISSDTREDLPDYMGPRVYYGTVDKIDAKQLVIIAGDKRIIRFDIFDATKYFRDEEEVKRSDVREGDEVRVEADRSEKGFLAATRVFIDETAESKKAKAEAETKPEEQPEEKAEAGDGDDRPTIQRETDMSDYSRPPPRAHIPVDDDDPGPPRLRRKSGSDFHLDCTTCYHDGYVGGVRVQPPLPARLQFQFFDG